MRIGNDGMTATWDIGPLFEEPNHIGPVCAYEDYVLKALDPLRESDVGVAVVPVTHGCRLLYAQHRLSGEALEVATEGSDHLRALQALEIQRRARVSAQMAGFRPWL